MSRQDGLLPCRFCGEHMQLQVITVDMKNPDRDIVKCRICRGEAPRKYWNTITPLVIDREALAKILMQTFPMPDRPTVERYANSIISNLFTILKQRKA